MAVVDEAIVVVSWTTWRGERCRVFDDRVCALSFWKFLKLRQVDKLAIWLL